MKKRGQISFYLVLGAILLLLVIFFVTKSPTNVINQPSQKVSLENKPINEFVKQCMQDTVKDALKLAMDHGGYIYTDNLTINPVKTTEGNAVEMIPDSNYKVPLWYFMQSKDKCTSCTFSSKRKPLCQEGRTDCIESGQNSIEEEIQRYLKENIRSCLKDFVMFKKIGYNVTTFSEPKFKVSFNDKEIITDLDYKLKIKKGKKTSEINSFTTKTPTLLPYFYKAALEIANYESSNCFLETHMINMISLYSGMNKELPPFYGTSSDITDLLWIKPKVHKKVDQIRSSYIPTIRFGNSTTSPYPKVNLGKFAAMEQGISDRFTYFPFKEFTNLRAYLFSYPWFTTYLDVFPNSGSLIGPSEVTDYSGNYLSKLLGTIVEKQYDFSYMYSFPTVIELRKFDQDGNEQMFRFALEANIRANKCFGPNATLGFETAADQSLLCDPLFSTKDNKTIIFKDEFTKKPIKDVSVQFHAGDTCNLGTSNSDGKLITPFPNIKEGSVLKFSKDGYLDQFIYGTDFSSNMVIKLKPLIEKNVSVNIFNLSTYKKMGSSANPIQTRDENLYQPNSNYTIIVNLDRIKDSYKDPDYNQVVTYSDGEFMPKTIKLTKGKYNVDINLFLKGNFTLVEEKDRMCQGKIGGTCVKTPVSPTCFPRGTPDKKKQQEDWRKSNCYIDGYTCESAKNAREKGSTSLSNAQKIALNLPITGAVCIKKCMIHDPIVIPETNISTLPLGGAVLNKSNNYFKILNYNKLNNSKAVNFYSFEMDIPIRHYEMGNLMKYQNYSMNSPLAIRPRLI